LFDFCRNEEITDASMPFPIRIALPASKYVDNMISLANNFV
jgi:hypothetical protein